MGNERIDLAHKSANGRWPDILAALGVDRGSLRNRNGPCPGCGGRDRFRFDNKQQNGSFICSQGGGDLIAGDGFKLLEHVHGWRFLDALEAVEGFLGISQGPAPKVANKPRRPIPAKGTSSDEAFTDEEKRRIALTKKIYDLAHPIAGTPAEAYLRNRGIDGELPENLRWAQSARQGFGALVVPSVTDGNEVQAVQRILLTAAGAKAPVKPDKITKGVLRQSAARFPGNLPIVLAEGPETALSVWLATGRETWAVLGIGNFKSAPIKDGDAVTIAADDFEPGSQAEKATHNAARALAARGCDVRLTHLPPGCGDFNDVHQRDGLDAVREIIDAAEMWVEQLPGVPPGVSIEEGAAELRRLISEFVHGAVPRYALAKSQPDVGNLPIKPVWILNGTTGIGKSREANLSLAEHLDSGGGPVCVFVPTHKLSQQQAKDFTKASGFPAAVWLGLNQPDPQTHGERMCLVPKLSGAAVSAGASLKDICAICTSRTECGYVRQQSQRAPIWFLAHEMLFSARPPGVPNPDFIVIDEDFRQAGMAQNLKLALSMLQTRVGDVLGRDERELLSAGRVMLVRAMRASMPTSGYGYLTAEALADCGLTSSWADEFRSLEFDRKPSAQIIQDDIEVTVENLNKVAAGFSFHVPKLWELVADALRGQHEYAPGIEIRRNDETVRLSYRKVIAGSWADKPTLILDATARPEIIQHFLPNAVLKADIHVSAPYEQVTWINHPFTIARLVPSSTTTEKRNQSRRNNLADLRRWVEVQAAKVWPRKMLVICNKAVETLLREGHLAQNVLVSHFNNNRGVNSWRGVHWSEIGTLAVVGRTLPDAKQIQRQAEQFAGKPLEPDDEIVQAIRWLICEAELLNGAIGRGRGVHRTADNPLQIFLLNDVPLPVAYDQVITWPDAQPSHTEVLATRGVLGGNTGQKVYWNAISAAAPDLFPSADAARMALSREQSSMNIIYIDDCSRERTGYRHRVKPHGARYSVEIRLDGCSLLTPSRQYFSEVETLEFAPCPHAGVLVNLWLEWQRRKQTP